MKMINKENKEIFEEIAKLPVNIQRAIHEFDWGSVVLDIAKKYQLGIDGADVLHNQTLLVMLNIEPAQNYSANLEQQLHIDRQTAEALVEEANKRIFSELQKRAFSKNQDSTKIVGKPVIERIQPKQLMEQDKLAKTVIKKGDVFHMSPDTQMGHNDFLKRLKK